MLRDKNLIPLSHQHQHALALCVRIERASPIAEADLKVWQLEIAQIFQAEIANHFEAEETLIFPAARRLETLVLLVEDLLRDHTSLRESFTQAESGNMNAAELTQFAKQLSAHIRKEERQLFERMQELMSPEILATLGAQLEAALKNATQACVLPKAATRLRVAK